MNSKFESCPPKPEALINSLRAFGYSLSMAIADLIDNSIFAKANNIAVDYDWNCGQPWIRITDNGIGMTGARLVEAMRLGSQSPLEEREETDLGRFGLGLKTASFSQCKVLTVKSKTMSGQTSTRSWNLDHVCASKKWELAKEAPPNSRRFLSDLDKNKQGTVVLWQKLDRVAGEKITDNEESHAIFLAKFHQVVQYLEMVFHRYLTGKKQIKLSVGRHVCQPWDPFLLKNEFTQELSTEILDRRQVKVTPFVLPHVSKRTREESEKGSGLFGWNAHQGFYIYRNRRMIIPGGYLDFDITPEEHYKLCRIRVDLPNSVDHKWCIDVRKAAASPPSQIRNELRRIAKAARSHAQMIYRARTGSSRNISRQLKIHDVWLKKRRGDKILYEINKGNEAIKRILAEVHPKKTWINKLFHLIEKSVPHRLIIMDNAEFEDCHVDLPDKFAPPPKELLDLCKKIFLEQIRSGKDPNQAADFVCAFFDNHLSYRIMLDELIEENQ